MHKQTNKQTTYNKTLIALLVSSATSLAFAQSNQTALPEIVVYGEQNQFLTSSQSITQDEMKKTPTTNGNITDYLRSNPHIRYENSDQSGFQRGEIQPENISINGADFNQTTFFVDNVNVNNDMGFSGFFDGAMATLPHSNHSQAYFFDANLLSSVVVHDSNISASLGGFSGGAVVAKTKQYSGKDGIKLSYRTTNSSWAKLKIEEKDKENFYKSVPTGNVADYQPKYSKYFFNLAVEKSLSENIGMVVGLSRRHSNIQQTRLINPNGDQDKQNHTRRSDNALLNFNFTPNDQHRFELGLRYSNYREGTFFAENINNNIFDYHNAYGATFSWINALPSGVLTTTLAYDIFTDKRKSKSTHMKTIIVDENSYATGGMGSSYLKQKNLHLSTEYALNPFKLGQTEHSVSLGGIFQKTHYHFVRYDNAFGETELYFPDYLDHDQDGDTDELAPMPGDSNLALKGKVTAQYKNISLYAEDLIAWKNFELRAGLRLERDDYLKNTNIAPRTVLRYKPFTDTALSVGWNRYYGRSFASMKLTEGIFKLDGHDTFRYKNITSFKTPHTDELSFGINQNLGNFAFNLKYILRNNKNRIVLDQDDTSNRYYRTGKDYKANVFTLQVNNIEPWILGPTHWNANLGFDWLTTKMIDTGVQGDYARPVILNGKAMSYGEMLKKVNNLKPDWLARVGVDMAMPNLGLNWSNRIVVKAPTVLVEDVSESNSNPPIYRSRSYGKHIQWDSSIRWQPTLKQKHQPYIKLDILNVLNKTRKGIGPNGEDLGIYTPGREFWLELGYEF